MSRQAQWFQCAMKQTILCHCGDPAPFPILGMVLCVTLIPNRRMVDASVVQNCALSTVGLSWVECKTLGVCETRILIHPLTCLKYM